MDQILSIAKTKQVIVSVVVWMGLMVSVSLAAEISGVQFSEFYQNQGIRMSLQGTGLKTMLFFKAFVAGYYTNLPNAADPLGEFSKRIEVEYFVNIPGKKLNNYTIEQMKANISEEMFQSLSAQIKLMGEYFVDLKKGDRFALTYIPGRGTEFSHNGRVTGVIPGLAFAKALFSVWIGEKPFDPQLKEQIYGAAHSLKSEERVIS